MSKIKKGRKKSEKKHITPKDIEIPMSQAIKLFREGARGSLSDCRISRRAVEAAVLKVQRWLKQTGENTAEAAHYLRQKTVKPKTLWIAFPQEKMSCAPWIKQSIDFAVAGKDKKTKYDRGLPHFSEAPVVRVFKKGLDRDNNISEKAKRAIVALAEAKMRLIGRRSAVFTKNAERSIVSLRDVESSFE